MRESSIARQAAIVWLSGGPRRPAVAAGMEAREESRPAVVLAWEGHEVVLDPVADFLEVGGTIVSIEGLDEARRFAEAVNSGTVDAGSIGEDPVNQLDVESRGFLSLEDFLEEAGGGGG